RTRNLKRLLCVLGVPFKPMPCDIVRRDVLRPSQTRDSCPSLALFHPRGVTASHGTRSYGSREPGFIAAVPSGRHTSFSLCSSTLRSLDSVGAEASGSSRTGRAGRTGYQCARSHL